MRPIIFWLTSIIPGYAAMLVSAYYVLIDWATLNRAFAHYEQLVNSGADLRALTVAANYEQAFRINCFAEGIGVLLGGIWGAIGIYGLCRCKT